ncbi:MAG: DUF2798 domain-containing protein [Beijerinckiaceae bacterium]
MDGKAKYIFPALMGGMMAFFMTAIITMINFGGIPAGFFGKWMTAFIIAWPLAALAAFIAGPIARRWTGRIVAVLDNR